MFPLRANIGVITMTTIQDRLAQWMLDRQGKYYYTQDMTIRSNPDSSGGTDCSALLQYAYRTVAGIEIGSWTGSQQHYGREVVSRNDTYDSALRKLAVGDLVFFDWDGYQIDNFDHVEMYIGDGKTIGHGGPGIGPSVKTLSSQWRAAHTITARRYIESGDEMTPEQARMLKEMHAAITGMHKRAGDGQSGETNLSWVLSWTDAKHVELRNILFGIDDKLNALIKRGVDIGDISEQLSDAVRGLKVVVEMPGNVVE